MSQLGSDMVAAENGGWGFGGLLESVTEAASDAAESVTESVTGTVIDSVAGFIPGRGLIWEVDLDDPHYYKLTPLARGGLAILAVYGVIRLMGR